MKTFLKSNYPIFFLLIVSFLVKFIFYQNKPLYWDDSVYIAIGKYLYSAGQVGFIEPFRPIVWPLILGLLWKFNLNIFFWGSLMQLFFGLGCVYFVYCIGEKVFNQMIGLLAASCFAFSSAVHYWNNGLLTDVQAAFIGLWAVHLLLNRKYFLCGFIGIMAFLIRFTQAVTLEFIFIYLIIQAIKSKQVKPVILFILGVICLLIPYLAYNYFAYGNVFKAFIDSKSGYGQYTVPWIQGMTKVVVTLFDQEGWIFIFVVPAMIFIFKRLSLAALLVLAIGIFQFIWVGKLPVAVMRYLVSCLPYMYILCAVGIYEIFVYLNYHFRLISKIFVIFVFGLFFQLVLRTTSIQFNDGKKDAIQLYTIENFEKLKGKRIWMSNPKYSVYADLKISEYLYSGANNFNYYKSHLSEADYILLDSTGIDCPQNKTICEKEKWELIAQIQSDFQEVVSIPSQDPQKVYAVYKNKRLE